MRKLCLVAVLLALPLTATAQQPHRRADDRRSADRGSDQRADKARQDNSTSTTKTSTPTPPPPANGATGLGLPQIGLSPAKSSMPSSEQNKSPWWEHQAPPPWERQQVPAWETKNPARTLLERDRNQIPATVDRNHGHGNDRRVDIVYLVPPYRYFATTLPGINEHYVSAPPPTTPVVVGTVQTTAVPVGALRIEVEPRDLLQVFVDGVFVGTPADHGDEIELAPGVRHVELRARGYRPLAFEAEILADRLITYRGALERDEAADPSTPAPRIITAPAASVPTTMYVIPGCYLGNVEPKESDLKPGCNIRSMIKIIP